MNLQTEKVFQKNYRDMAVKIDRMFGTIFIGQWLFGITLAFFVSPKSWAGAYSQTHIHVYMAIFLGGLTALFPAYLNFAHPGERLNRNLNSVAQMLFTILFIHLTGGRIETHFHVFGSLAFLAFYRDWRLLAIGTFVTAADHLLRGIYWPQSVYGVLAASPWRSLEHAGWVIFEDVILLYSISNGLKELHTMSQKQVELEEAVTVLKEANLEELHRINQSLEQAVRERTAQIIEAESKLVHSSKMSALGEMAGGVAHEINNPLAVIKMNTAQVEELLRGETTDKKLIISRISSIIRMTDRIEKIVRGLKSISRDGNEDPFQKVNVRNLIDDTLQLCQERIRRFGTGLIVDPIDENLSFHGRETQISQVVLNLLNNSFDAIEDLPNKWIRLNVQSTEEWLEIRVIDCGAGVPESVQKKIFEPFFTTKEIGKGTGLGLSISVGILRQHNGELKIDSEIANTCFVVRLPISQVRLQKAKLAA